MTTCPSPDNFSKADIPEANYQPEDVSSDWASLALTAELIDKGSLVTRVLTRSRLIANCRLLAHANVSGQTHYEEEETTDREDPASRVQESEPTLAPGL